MPPMLNVCLGDDSADSGQAKFRPEHLTDREERAADRGRHGRSGTTERPESRRGHREGHRPRALSEEEAAQEQAAKLSRWRQKARARGGGRAGGEQLAGAIDEQMEC